MIRSVKYQQSQLLREGKAEGQGSLGNIGHMYWGEQLFTHTERHSKEEQEVLGGYTQSRLKPSQQRENHLQCIFHAQYLRAWWPQW